MHDQPKPIQIKHRVSFHMLERGHIDVRDGAFVLIDKTGIRTQIPAGATTCLLLEPGTRISHAAVMLAARVGCLLLWIGEGGVRTYSAGQPGGARSDRLLWQASLVLDEQARLKVVRKMFELRFGEPAPQRRSVRQLQALEGARVKASYKMLARQCGFTWKGRNYDTNAWTAGDIANRCLSAATSCLYGVTEAAILAAGYAPAIGFIHTGKPRSFVYDIADIFKFPRFVELAFRVAKRSHGAPEREVRRGCRDVFREDRILNKLVDTIHEVLNAGELPVPKPGSDQLAPAIKNTTRTGDVGHRT